MLAVELVWNYRGVIVVRVIADIQCEAGRMVDEVLAASWRGLLHPPSLAQASVVLCLMDPRLISTVSIAFVNLKHQTALGILQQYVRALLSYDPQLVLGSHEVVENQIALSISMIVRLASVEAPVSDFRHDGVSLSVALVEAVLSISLVCLWRISLLSIPLLTIALLPIALIAVALLPVAWLAVALSTASVVVHGY